MKVESPLNVNCGDYSVATTKFIIPFYRRFPSRLIARIMTQKTAVAKAILMVDRLVRRRKAFVPFT